MKRALSLLLVLTMAMFSIMPSVSLAEEFFTESSSADDSADSSDFFSEDFFGEAEEIDEEPKAEETAAAEEDSGAAEAVADVAEEPASSVEEESQEEAEAVAVAVDPDPETEEDPAEDEEPAIPYAMLQAGTVVYQDEALSEKAGVISEESVVIVTDTLDDGVLAVTGYVDDAKTGAFISADDAVMLNAREAELIVKPVIVFAEEEAEEAETAEPEEETADEAEEAEAAETEEETADEAEEAEAEEETADEPEETETAETEEEAADEAEEAETAETEEAEAEQTEEAAEEDELVERNLDDEELTDRLGSITDLAIRTAYCGYDPLTKGYVGLKWSQVSGATSYQVRWATSESTLSSSSGWSSTTVDTSSTYTDDEGKTWMICTIGGVSGQTLALGQTYWFAVIPMKGSTASTLSNKKSYTVSSPAPTNFKGSVTTKTGEAKFQWDDMSSGGASGYLLYNYTSDPTYKTILNKNNLTALNYTVTGLTAGETYVFHLFSFYDKNNDGKYTAGTDVRSTNYAELTWVVYPSAPTGLIGVSLTTTSAKLSWNKVNGAAGYNIYYQQGEVVYPDEAATLTVPVGDSGLTASGSTLSYTVSGLGTGLTYTFVVQAYTANGWQSEFSDPSATVTLAPGAITNPAGTWDVDMKQITVSWDAVDYEITGYRIYWSTSSDSFTDTDSVDVGGQTSNNYIFTTEKLTAMDVGSTYYFKVVGYYGTTVGDKDAAKLVKVVCKPAKTLNLKVYNKSYSTSTGGVVTLKWDPTAGAVGYQYDRSTTSTFTASTTVRITVGNVDTCEDSGLKLGTLYYYRIAAYVDGDDGNPVLGPWSETVKVTSTVGRPTSLAVTNYAESAIVSRKACGLHAEWDAVPGCDGYYVRIQDHTGSWVTFSGLSSTKAQLKGSANTSYNITGLKAGELYKVKISAYKGSYESTGAYETGSPTLWAPTKTTMTQVSSSSVKVSWSSIYGVTGYRICVWSPSTNHDANFVPIIDHVQSYKYPYYTVSGMRDGYEYQISIESYSSAQETTIYSGDAVNTWISGGDDPNGDTVCYGGTSSYTSYDGSRTGNAYQREVTPTPVKPTNLKATVVYDASTDKPKVRLTWTGSSSATGYYVYRYVDGTAANDILAGTVTKDADGNLPTTYDYDGLTASDLGKTVTFYVTSYITPVGDPSKSEESDVSAAAGVTVNTKKPTVYVDHTDDGLIILKWKQETWLAGEFSYNIYRYTSSSYSKAYLVGTVASGNTSELLSWEDSTCTKYAVGKKLYYWVQPVLTTVTPTYYGTVSAAKVAQRSGAPATNLAIATYSGGTEKVFARSVYLTWTRPTSTSGLTGFTIYGRYGTATSWTKLGTAKKTATTFHATGLKYHETYTFGVAANYTNGATSKICTYTMSDPLRLTKVNNLTAANTSSTKLTWTKVPDATSYKVVLYNPNGYYMKSYTTSTNSKTISGLTKGLVYSAVVYPVIKYGSTTYPTVSASTPDPNEWSLSETEYIATVSDVVSVYVGPGTPGSIKVSTTKPTNRYVSWSKVTVKNVSEVQYVLQRYDTAISTWVDVYTGTSTFFKDTESMTKGTKFKYRVRAFYTGTDTFYGPYKTTSWYTCK